MKILVMNAGSSSQKSRLYEINTTPSDTVAPALWEGDADWTKEKSKAQLRVSNVHGQKVEMTIATAGRPAIIEQMLQMLWCGEARVLETPTEIAIVGHRVVHGGADYRESVLITPQVKEAIKRLSAFAPLHNPANLEGIEIAEHLLSNMPQVAVFDTAFHSRLPLQSIVYPVPYEWFEQGIRRYGFHGISHQYCACRSAQIVGRDLNALRIINCHLGNGCSLAAIKHGHSIETTMGFTPLEGLMMGSRSGSIDPSILFYLQCEKGYTAEQLEHILNKESGLKGVSGISSDMRELKRAIDAGSERAQLALDIFIYRLRLFIGAMVAALGGVDVLTFTGGVGEHVAEVRARACAAFGFLNLSIDAEKNLSSPVDQDIATAASAVRVLVVHTEEDWEIARECWRILHS